MTKFLKYSSDIEAWLRSQAIKDYQLIPDIQFGFMVDVCASVDLSDKSHTFIPVKFNRIEGNFLVSHNELTSLDFCPQIVSGNFSCAQNRLTSLNGSPKIVGGSYNCDRNLLTNLAGSPELIRGSLYARHNKIENLKDFPRCEGSVYLSGNKLKSLVGAPSSVQGHFDCSANQLTTLKGEGGPKIVLGTFNCSSNHLKTLEGSPTHVSNFVASHNRLQSLRGISLCGNRIDVSYNRLVNLEGAPDKVVGSFNCEHNLLTSLKGSPQTVEGDFDCSTNLLESLQYGPHELGHLATYVAAHNRLNTLAFIPEKAPGGYDLKNNSKLGERQYLRQHSALCIEQVKDKIVYDIKENQKELEAVIQIPGNTNSQKPVKLIKI